MSSVTENPYIIAFLDGAIYSGLLNGTMAHIGTTGLTGDTPVSMQLTDDVDGKSKVFAVDGTDALVIEPVTGTIDNWGSRVLTEGVGDFPTRCALVAAWRGRAVLARQAGNKSIWYMSRVGKPYDWDYGADPTQTAAVAGTDPKIGLPGDSITALIPSKDDFLVFGCRNSIYQMVGDPGYGGTVQTLTTKTGVLGPKTWCFDEMGGLYFMAPSGLHYCNATPQGIAQPIPIKQKCASYLLDRIDSESSHVEMAYDYLNKSVEILIQPLDGSLGIHVRYDTIFKAFWPVKYGHLGGVWSICEIHGNADIDRQFLLGGDNGYIQRPDADEAGDDGKAIESYIRLAPIAMDKGQYECMARELQATGVDGDGPVEWRWHVGNSPSEVSAQALGAEQVSGTWFATSTGFQDPVGLRMSGGAHQLVIYQNSKTQRWAMEEVQALVAETGRRRGASLTGGA